MFYNIQFSSGTKICTLSTFFLPPFSGQALSFFTYFTKPHTNTNIIIYICLKVKLAIMLFVSNLGKFITVGDVECFAVENNVHAIVDVFPVPVVSLVILW